MDPYARASSARPPPFPTNHSLARKVQKRDPRERNDPWCSYNRHNFPRQKESQSNAYPYNNPPYSINNAAAQDQVQVPSVAAHLTAPSLYEQHWVHDANRYPPYNASVPPTQIIGSHDPAYHPMAPLPAFHNLVSEASNLDWPSRNASPRLQGRLPHPQYPHLKPRAASTSAEALRGLLIFKTPPNHSVLQERKPGFASQILSEPIGSRSIAPRPAQPPESFYVPTQPWLQQYHGSQFTPSGYAPISPAPPKTPELSFPRGEVYTASNSQPVSPQAWNQSSAQNGNLKNQAVVRNAPSRSARPRSGKDNAGNTLRRSLRKEPIKFDRPIFDISLLYENGFTVIEGQVYDEHWQSVCGITNELNKPCRSVGVCPFHPDQFLVSKINSCNGTVDAAGNALLLEGKTKDRCEPVIRGFVKDFSFPIMKQNKNGWSIQEHFLFLTGLKYLGNGNWKEISELVRTRTAVQCQSHAVKHCKRQAKVDESKVKRTIHDLTLESPEIKSYANRIRKESVMQKVKEIQKAYNMRVDIEDAGMEEADDSRGRNETPHRRTEFPQGRGEQNIHAVTSEVDQPGIERVLEQMETDENQMRGHLQPETPRSAVQSANDQPSRAVNQQLSHNIMNGVAQQTAPTELNHHDSVSHNPYNTEKGYHPEGSTEPTSSGLQPEKRHRLCEKYGQVQQSPSFSPPASPSCSRGEHACRYDKTPVSTGMTSAEVQPAQSKPPSPSTREDAHTSSVQAVLAAASILMRAHKDSNGFDRQNAEVEEKAHPLWPLDINRFGGSPTEGAATSGPYNLNIDRNVNETGSDSSR